VARRLVHRSLEIGVAKAAIAALGKQESLADFGEIGDQRFAVLLIYLRALRHLQHNVGTFGAVAVAPHAVHAGLGLEVLLVTVIDQGVEAGHDLHPDIAATAAIAAVGAAEFNEFLAPERDSAGAAVARSYMDLCLVEKFHCLGVPMPLTCAFLLQETRAKRDSRTGMVVTAQSGINRQAAPCGPPVNLP
jgi:hypothetical protein